ncbi:MAG: hypothetical protein AAF481_00545 [Acidobacteriota bacterium]
MTGRFDSAGSGTENGSNALNATLCAAIRQRKTLRFHYKGGYRVGEPWAHGVSHAGAELALIYQTEGHSSSGQPLGWRTFRLDRLWELETLEATAADHREGYDPATLPMTTICCQR